MHRCAPGVATLWLKQLGKALVVKAVVQYHVLYMLACEACLAGDQCSLTWITLRTYANYTLVSYSRRLS
jgi:hypothetical protein